MRYTPQQNGVAERLNRTLLEKIRSMLFEAKLPKVFWGEALVTTAYLKNRTPSSSIRSKTPFELWFGKPPRLRHLKVFGCQAYIHQKLGKLDPRSLVGLFMGYPYGTKGYRMMIKE